ncbi:MAG: metalloregulator ArsR/SmtB family transcription factor [Candidatus Latescibacteria bacterium]|nr:metalloregulator ArsR/SmtB family transcription factor [bacterium]MBD3423162.1 metalloregulator ArsR/SmtB family transcription factor [Candidatus Latescibacterota bacterium]
MKGALFMVNRTMNMKELETAVKAAADFNRLRILNMLSVRDMCVCELAEVVGITQPSVSRHLKKLTRGGFIDSRHDGRWTDYYLRPANSFAFAFLDELEGILAGDETAERDLEDMKTARRESICGVEK